MTATLSVPATKVPFGNGKRRNKFLVIEQADLVEIIQSGGSDTITADGVTLPDKVFIRKAKKVKVIIVNDK